MNTSNLEISQEVFRRMNESGQTNYLKSLFLNLSAEKIVQNMDKLDSNKNFSLLFPRKTDPHFDQEELERCHIANNIVFLFLQKHKMKITSNTAFLEFSSKYISNKNEQDLKTTLNCPKSESLIQSLIKFHINNISNDYNSNEYSSTKYNSNNYNSNKYNSNNYSSNNYKNNTSYNIEYNSNTNTVDTVNSNDTNRKITKKNDSSKSNSTNISKSTIISTISTIRKKITTKNNITNDNNNNDNNNNNTNSKNKNSNLNIYINNYNSPRSKSVNKIKTKKKIEKLERGIKSPKNNCVTIKWDMSKSGSGNTSYVYNSYNCNTYDHSDSGNGQYYDSICYDSEETLRNEMKMINISKGAVRKVDLLRPNFNFKHSKLEELLEIKRQNLSSKMFLFQVTVTIIEAKDLSIIDFLSSLDPFCTIQLANDKTYKTKVIENTKSPVWNNYFQCEFETLDADTCLKAEIYDSDPLGTDKKLSSLQIYLFDVMDDLTIDKWFEMDSDTIFKLRPQLHLKINVDLKEKHTIINNPEDLASQNSYDYDLNSDDDDHHQPNDNKLWF